MRYRITAPVSDFSGTVAGVAFTDGTATLDDAQPTGVAALGYFQRKGYVVESDAPAADAPPESGPAGQFDPSEHDVKAVLAYLEGADQAEAARVLDAEAAGKNRKGIIDARDAILVSKKESDQ